LICRKNLHSPCTLVGRRYWYVVSSANAYFPVALTVTAVVNNVLTAVIAALTVVVILLIICSKNCVVVHFAADSKVFVFSCIFGKRFLEPMDLLYHRKTFSASIFLYFFLIPIFIREKQASANF
jgi:hypothetical protein